AASCTATASSPLVEGSDGIEELGSSLCTSMTGLGTVVVTRTVEGAVWESSVHAGRNFLLHPPEHCPSTVQTGGSQMLPQVGTTYRTSRMIPPVTGSAA
ncbi:MAG: hypothetical protein PHO92_05150, partial [Candidatus Peribacteraceae bacterium]|nr:hypothetical protein [Candidatus Peribacteraceae bacterium]